MKTWMNLTYYVELKKPDTKENRIHDSIRMKSNNGPHQSKAMGKQNGGDLWREAWAGEGPRASPGMMKRLHPSGGYKRAHTH